MYSQFWLNTKLSKDRGKELIFSSTLASGSVLYFIFLFILVIFFPSVFHKLGTILKFSKILYVFIFSMILLPLDIYFYQKYKIYYNEFMRKIERKKRRRYLSDKCVKCGRSFKEARRYENTNLCEECFNKSLEGEE